MNESKAAIKSEFARLANAKRLSDSLALQLECEEARLKAEIDFLTRCLEDSLTVKDEQLCNHKDINSLVTECNQLKKDCLKSIKVLACSDHLETSRAKFERRKARQAAYIDYQNQVCKLFNNLTFHSENSRSPVNLFEVGNLWWYHGFRRQRSPWNDSVYW